MRALGLLPLLLASTGWVQAEVLQIPCEEYSAATGEVMPCHAIPMIKVERERYEAKKAEKLNRESPDSEKAPWMRGGAAAGGSEPETAEDCNLPPWMRSENCIKK